MHNTVSLKRPEQKTTDSGDLRLGDAEISFEAPALSRPDEATEDSGDLRLGDAEISGSF
jgi:hypothetical protein